MKVEQIERKWAKNVVNTGFCFSDCLKTVAMAMGRHCEFEFFHCYDLNITCSGKIMPEIREKFQRVDYLEQYHGLKLSVKKYPEEISLEEIKELVRKKPLILRANAIYCPWDPSYQKTELNEIDNTTHYFIIYGISDDGMQFECCDAYYNLTGLTIPVSEIPKMLSRVFYLEEIGEERIPSVSEFREKAEEIWRPEGENSVDRIFQTLLKHLEEHWETWKAGGKEACLAIVSPLCWEMVSFMQRGIYFANMADFYGEEGKELGERFATLGEVCSRICTVCLKCSYTGKLSDKVLDGVRDVLAYLEQGKAKEA